MDSASPLGRGGHVYEVLGDVCIPRCDNGQHHEYGGGCLHTGYSRWICVFRGLLVDKQTLLLSVLASSNYSRIPNWSDPIGSGGRLYPSQSLVQYYVLGLFGRQIAARAQFARV